MDRLGLVSLALLAIACSKPADKAPAPPAVTIADTGATTNPPAELPMEVAAPDHGFGSGELHGP